MKKLRLKFLAIILVAGVLVPLIVFAQACPPDPATGKARVCLWNPLAFIGVGTPAELVVKVIGVFSGIIAFAAVAFTVFNGFKMVIATEEEALKTAREGIKWSVGGLVVALLSFGIVASVANFVGFEPGQIQLTPEGDKIIKNPILIPGDPSGLAQSASFVDILSFVMVNFLGIVGLATTLMLIYYGFKYITAAGNEEMIEQAKTGLKWSILGFVTALLAFAIITIVRTYLLQGP